MKITQLFQHNIFRQSKKQYNDQKTGGFNPSIPAVPNCDCLKHSAPY